MLLIITMLPLTALGADGDMITLGVTTKGNSYNGSGVAGRTYGSDPERIWGKMTSDSTGKSQTYHHHNQQYCHTLFYCLFHIASRLVI